MKLLYFFLLVFILGVTSCKKSTKASDSDRLAEVNGEVIYLSDAVEGMPKGLSSKDSIAYLKLYIQNKVNDILLYEQAQKNLPDVEALDALVESYRRSLIIHSYQQELMNEKWQQAISDTILQVFYENNRDRFVTGHDLVKGVFIMVPKSAPGMQKIKSIYKKTTDESFQQIESFCVQNGGKVEFFLDRWVLFVDLLGKASYNMSNPTGFLKTSRSLDVVVGDYQYLLYIDDYVSAGETAPFEYVKEEVRSVVTNMQKTTFVHDFERDLYRQALKKGKITYFDENLKKTN